MDQWEKVLVTKSKELSSMMWVDALYMYENAKHVRKA